MARVLGGPLDFAKNEAKQLRLQVLSTDPGSAVDGMIYYNSVSHTVRAYLNGAWADVGSGGGSSYTVDGVTIEAPGSVLGLKALGITNSHVSASAAIVRSKLDFGSGLVNSDIASGAAIANSKLATDPLARANHTGTQLAATVSDLATVVKAYRLDEFATPNTDVSLNSHKLTSVTDPVNPQDGATKAYVDSVASGLDAKASVRVATVANGTLATAFANGQTVDGVVLATGDRILLKDQSSPSENGIRVVAASGAPSRATDADTWAELVSAFVFVEQGTVNADNGFVCTVDAGGTINSTAVTFTQFSGAGQITAGNGLTKTGNTLDVQVDGSTIEINSDTLRVKAAGINLTSHVTGALPVANGGTGQTTAKAARETGLAAAGFYNTETHSSGTTITIAQSTHGLRASKGVLVKTYTISSGDERLDDVNVASNGDVVITFSVSQSANTIGVTLVG